MAMATQNSTIPAVPSTLNRESDPRRQAIDRLGPWFQNLHLPDGVETAPDVPVPMAILLWIISPAGRRRKHETIALLVEAQSRVARHP